MRSRKQNLGWGWRKRRATIKHTSIARPWVYTAQVPLPTHGQLGVFRDWVSIHHFCPGGSTLSLRSQMCAAFSWVTSASDWASLHKGTSIMPRAEFRGQLWLETLQGNGEACGHIPQAAVLCLTECLTLEWPGRRLCVLECLGVDSLSPRVQLGRLMCSCQFVKQSQEEFLNMALGLRGPRS